jgi:hypothetical protein
VADLDLDGLPEILAGPTAYRLAGGVLTKVWQRTDRPDGYVGIANFDDDPFPEIVIVGNGPGQVYMLNHDGTDAEVWNPPTHAPIPLPGGGDGGAPTIADLDGDGIPEIGVAALLNYSVFNRDGAVRWKTAIRDYSSHQTGSTVFDFDGDGSVELVTAKNSSSRLPRRGWCRPRQDPYRLQHLDRGTVVADVDNDGHADIVVSSDRHSTGASASTGVFVIQDVANKWHGPVASGTSTATTSRNVNEDEHPLVETPHCSHPGSTASA